ncbi:tRNA pseudouridine(38-40) synthase TruA [Desulfosediminicola flagellatus]|uniref:tRNA pseudouridine(38-40) synthase TruA n=1 Tax=Desulfosediminicola flagellatus TaxID=2569541 RepID=UPI001E4F5B72|nr:tRNA pseudouridine(38-40) synthase TruA [Desulfosediminicola flagellatus]
MKSIVFGQELPIGRHLLNYYKDCIMTRKPTTRRYKLTLEYDGKNFSGWQKQKDARTVQGDLLKGAARVFGEDATIDIQGCGRTDAGVHALEYVAHLQVASKLKPHVVEQMLNETLPKDIAVMAVEPADPLFHARHNCVARSYIYQLRSSKSAFGKRYSWWVREKLDIDAMRSAALLMEGMHDFAAFAEKKELKKSTKVLIHKVDVVEDQDAIRIRVVGSHFLWHMVRRIVGVLVEVGCHRLTEDDIRGLCSGSASEIPSHHTAPAAGLFFEKACYDKQLLDDFVRD